MDGKENCSVCQGVDYRVDPDLKEQRLCNRRGTDGCKIFYSTKQLQGAEKYEVIFRNKGLSCCGNITTSHMLGDSATQQVRLIMATFTFNHI